MLLKKLFENVHEDATKITSNHGSGRGAGRSCSVGTNLLNLGVILRTSVPKDLARSGTMLALLDIQFTQDAFASSA